LSENPDEKRENLVDFERKECDKLIREVQVSDYEAICRISSEDLGYDCKQELVRISRL